ncbi:MAG TPA: metallophosphoesterase [Deltaproteobacteria bacterium]|nr:MAG: UDP-2,3-diacylglucosamine hydrolase [Deltaproteobacteria bacterium ADurb.Bin072]HNY67043.1 metallophosphoesterase [Deltaproteobacteria bacterium]
MVSVLRFVADIHLRPHAGDEIERFVTWLNGAAEAKDDVYILGDLFDYWYTGMACCFPAVIQALMSPRIHVLPGNRDFLLRNAPIRGVDIIENEEMTLVTAGKRILLAHGHTLTDADKGFRLLHRYGWPVMARIDRMLPTPIKDRLAKALVKSSAVVRPMRTDIRWDIAGIKGVDLVICGHLHRRVEREGLFVLPAFFDSGGWLGWDSSGPALKGPG